MIDALMSADPLGDGISSLELIDVMGTDLSVVNAARVSFANRSYELSKRDRKLINRMMRLRHGSPFEHVVFQFRVRAPLHVVHQWERHRVSSYNEESGRWSELRNDFFIPEEMTTSALLAEHCKRSYEFYEHALRMGDSKENARLFLPVNLYKEFIWTVNGRSVLNFISLRSDPEAQKHIRVYAEEIEEMLADFIPTVLISFDEHGRRQP